MRKGFESHPEFLWITLLIFGSHRVQSLANQGFYWIAHQKSKVGESNKINNLASIAPV
jgi:hypothetical protein